MVSKRDSTPPLDTKEAWLDIEAAAVARRLAQEGVTPERAAKIIEIYKEKVIAGVPPRYAEANLKPEVLQAKRDSQVDNIAKSLAARFHLPVSTVEAVVSKSVQRLRANNHLLPQVVMQKHEAELTKLSLEAYNSRRASQSPLAAALVSTGAGFYHKDTAS